MARSRKQLNINIDPELLLNLKSEAIKSGKTLTEFVTAQLQKIATESREDTLEARLLKIEEHLGLTSRDNKKKQQIGTIFTDEGAKEYGKKAKELFNSNCKKKRITIESGLEELLTHLQKYEYGDPELVSLILLDQHDLTGLEMTIAYRYGSCAMRSALCDWANEPLEDLNKAFLNAVIVKSLK